MNNIINLDIRILLGVIFVITGGVFLLSFLILFLRAYSRRLWNTTKGEIIDFTVRKMPSKTKVKYRPEVSYKYEIGGHQYVSNRIVTNEMPFRSNMRYIAMYRKKFNKGKEVTVFYQDGNPHSSILKLAVRTPIVVRFLLGWFFIIVGVWLFLAGLNFFR